MKIKVWILLLEMLTFVVTSDIKDVVVKIGLNEKMLKCYPVCLSFEPKETNF